jgi:lysophospholipase L1-like esterase
LGACFFIASLLAGCEGGDDNGGAAGIDGGGGALGGHGGDSSGDTGGNGGGGSSSAAAGQGGSTTNPGGSTSNSTNRTGGSTGTASTGGLSTSSTGKTGGMGGASNTASPGGTTSTASRPGGTGGSTSTGGTGGSATGPATVALRDGRFDITDATRPQFGWSGAALVARFQGTGAVARIDGSANQFTVIVDGNVSSTILKVVSGTSQYTVASGLTAGTHDIVIARRTEGNQGPSRFSGLDITGGQLLAPPAAPDRRIEIFGDSISAGYGLDGKGPNCAFTPDTENPYLTYGAITARALKAELHNNAWSGIGMVRNYGETAASSDAMPAIYARTIPDRTKNDWDFASWVPHVVVINLGTNDANKGDPGEPFRKAYLEFVRTLHQKYPSAAFVLTIGPMLGGAELTAISSHLQYVIDTMAAEGFTKMSRVVFPTQTEADGLGCDWHPGPAVNAKMATQLTNELKAKLNW